ncbi:MAG: DUF1738 domain-containing protein [Proteobacteria bacterium]|nr:DUF1738 domain-containing protein [Pseudomonadota bacterium]
MVKNLDMKKDFREEITGKIISDLEKGVIPWEKPWDGTGAGYIRPFNAVTGRPYRGGNAIVLFYESQGDPNDPRWATFKQVQDAGWKVKAGSKGTRIEFWTTEGEKQVKDTEGKVVKDAQGNPIKEKYEYSRPVSKTFYVFNGSQIEGIPPLPEVDRVKHQWEFQEKAELILLNSKAKIYHDQADRAFYRPLVDTIHLPQKDRFPDAEKYYGTALHELSHWTGHPTRLNRETSGKRFGSPGYAREELRAELASAFLSFETGVQPNIGQHAAYLQSWIEVLKQDKNEIFRAAKDADRISEYVMQFSREMEKAKGVTDLSQANANKGLTHSPYNHQPVQRHFVFVDAEAKDRVSRITDTVGKPLENLNHHVSQKEKVFQLDQRLEKDDHMKTGEHKKAQELYQDKQPVRDITKDMSRSM